MDRRPAFGPYHATHHWSCLRSLQIEMGTQTTVHGRRRDAGGALFISAGMDEGDCEFVCGGRRIQKELYDCVSGVGDLCRGFCYQCW